MKLIKKVPTQKFNNYLCESEDISQYTAEELKDAQKLFESVLRSIEENKGDISEGLFSGILGGITGAVAGPAIMKAVCSALGIEKGAIYDLLTSRLVITAIATKLGLRM